MPILNDAQRAALRTRLAAPDCADKSPKELFVHLNARPHDPAGPPAARIARPFRARELEALLAPVSLGRLLACPLGGHVIEVWDSGDPERSAGFARALAATDPPIITDAEETAILARIAETMPDPAHEPARIPSIADEVLGRGFVLELPHPPHLSEHAHYYGKPGTADYLTTEAIAEIL